MGASMTFCITVKWDHRLNCWEHHAEPGADAIDLTAVRRCHPAAPVGPHADQLSADVDLACVGNLQQVDAAEQRALAGAAGAQDGDHVVLVGGQRDALQHLQVAEALVEVVHVERGAGLCPRFALHRDGGSGRLRHPIHPASGYDV